MKRLHALFGLTLATTMVGCADDGTTAEDATASETGDTSTSSEGETEEGSCEPGTEDCPCYANLTCNTGLECVDDMCVPGDGDGVPLAQ